MAGDGIQGRHERTEGHLENMGHIANNIPDENLRELMAYTVRTVRIARDRLMEIDMIVHREDRDRSALEQEEVDEISVLLRTALFRLQQIARQ